MLTYLIIFKKLKPHLKDKTLGIKDFMWFMGETLKKVNSCNYWRETSLGEYRVDFTSVQLMMYELGRNCEKYRFVLITNFHMFGLHTNIFFLNIVLTFVSIQASTRGIVPCLRHERPVRNRMDSGSENSFSKGLPHGSDGCWGHRKKCHRITTWYYWIQL